MCHCSQNWTEGWQKIPTSSVHPLAAADPPLSFSKKRLFSGFVSETFMKNFPDLFAQRLNELNSQIAELEELRARIEQAERRASGVRTPRSTPKATH
jgi:hypothetical protein